MLFSDLNLNPNLMEGLNAMGFTTATPVQEQSMPIILQNRDLLACAQTGTGKTAAFILPILHKIVSSRSQGLNTLVIVPTRELAMQIDQQIEGLGYFVDVSSMAVFGGGDGISWEAQKKSLVLGTNIVVATPGRLISMLAMGKVDFSTLEHLVLDEADRMLDMGFFDDIMRIISHMPAKRQTLLFSATMPPKIELLANKILTNPHKFNLSLSKPAEGIDQKAFIVYNKQKNQLLAKILENQDFDSVLIFASTKSKVKEINEILRSQKLDTRAFNSDLEQDERARILRDFKNRQLRIIVATDVLARGIDVDNISLVVNYDAPGDPEDYVHRVGRTARATRTGVAITFVGEDEQRKFAGVEKLIGGSVAKEKLPEELGDGPVWDPSKRPLHAEKGHFKNFQNRSKGRPDQRKSNSRFSKPRDSNTETSDKNPENKAPRKRKRNQNKNKNGGNEQRKENG